MLLRDEVSLGLSPIAVEGVYAAIRKLRQSGTTIILVENPGRAVDFADRLICMLEGSVALEGHAKKLDPARITDACFGLQGAPR